MSIIKNFLYGWDNLEPILLGSLAKGFNIMLLGSHGCGKSLFARLVSSAIGNGDSFKFIKYSMDKENLLSMVGCPNPDDIRRGKISYSTHDRSIFHADVIMMDELTRAGRENQNMVLEILEERTMFGMPLKYQFAIATANEETYTGAYKLDAALLDRFVAVLPIPSIDSKDNMMGAEEISRMIELNQGTREENIEESCKNIHEAVINIRKTYDEIWNNKKIRNNINDFAAKFFSTLLENMRNFNKTIKSGKDNKIKISFRQISNQFVPLAISIASYYKCVRGDANYLQSGTWDAIKYSISTKLGFPTDKISPIFDNLKDLLIDGDTLMVSISVSLTTGELKNRIDTLEKYASFIKEKFDYAEQISILGNIINEIECKEKQDIINLIRLVSVIEKYKVNDTVENIVKLKLLNFALNVKNSLDVIDFFQK